MYIANLFKEYNYHNSTHTKLPMLLLIVLGTMTAFGPMIIDMYLPALPAVQQQFNTSTSSIQLTYPLLIGLALGQFIFGPLSDVFGRKNCTNNFSVFVLASCGAIFITTFPLFFIDTFGTRINCRRYYCYR